MKTAFALLQIFSLSDLLSMHVADAAEFRLSGARKDLQTIKDRNPAATPSGRRRDSLQPDCHLAVTSPRGSKTN